MKTKGFLLYKRRCKVLSSFLFNLYDFYEGLEEWMLVT